MIFASDMMLDQMTNPGAGEAGEQARREYG
jgi:hypothetical protein